MEGFEVGVKRRDLVGEKEKAESKEQTSLEGGDRKPLITAGRR